MYLMGFGIKWQHINDVYAHSLKSIPFLPNCAFQRRIYWKEPVYFGGKGKEQALKDEYIDIEENKAPEDLRQTLIDKTAETAGMSIEDIETDKSLSRKERTIEKLHFYLQDSLHSM